VTTEFYTQFLTTLRNVLYHLVPPVALPAVFSMFVCVCVRVLLTGLGSTLPPSLTSPGTGVHMHSLYTSVRNIHLKPVGARARLFTQSINLPPVVVNNDAFIQEALSSFTHSVLLSQ